VESSCEFGIEPLGYMKCWETTPFLDIEKAFDTTWNHDLLYKLCKLEFSTNVIKLISSFIME
jgi:hypothetical protein